VTVGYAAVADRSLINSLPDTPAVAAVALPLLQVIAYNKIDVPDSGDYWEFVQEYLVVSGKEKLYLQHTPDTRRDGSLLGGSCETLCALLTARLKCAAGHPAACLLCNTDLLSFSDIRAG
jgi:hypothetical protein